MLNFHLSKVPIIQRRTGILAIVTLFIIGPSVGRYIVYPRLSRVLSRVFKPRVRVKPKTERELRLQNLPIDITRDTILDAFQGNDGRGGNPAVQLMSLTPSLDGEHSVATVYLEGSLPEATEKEVAKGRLPEVPEARIDEHFHDLTPLYWPGDKWSVEYVQPRPEFPF